MDKRSLLSFASSISCLWCASWASWMTFFWIGILILLKWTCELIFDCPKRTAADWILGFRGGNEEWLWKSDSLYGSLFPSDVIVSAYFKWYSIVYPSFCFRAYCALIVDDIWVPNLERKWEWSKFDSTAHPGYSFNFLFAWIISTGRCFFAAVKFRLLALNILWWAFNS